MDVGLERIKLLSREELAAFAAGLEEPELDGLVETLVSKNDEQRYGALLLLLAFTENRDSLYKYWDFFAEKLHSENSYQRSIGLMLIARNAKWDGLCKMKGCIGRYLELCDDEKPVTVRQCIQNLAYILPYHNDLFGTVVQKLVSINLSTRKETQRKLLFQDIGLILTQINESKPDSRIEEYMENNCKWLKK